MTPPAFPRWRCGTFCTLPVLLFLGQTQALAAEPATTTPFSGGGLLQGLAGLAIVLAMIYGVFWLLRRYGPGQFAGQNAIRVVGGVMLGPRERLVIVEVENTWLLVGVGAGNVNLIHTLPKPEHAPTPTVPMPGDFAGKLASLLSQGRKAGNDA